MKRSLLTLLLLGGYSIGVMAECDFDDFPVMDEMHVQILMDNANYNNRPMKVRSYYADSSNHDVIQFYHRRWRGHYDDTAFGMWDQVTTLTDECMMTVQVAKETDSTSHGRLIISNPPTGNPEAKLGDGVVAPAESVVVSDLKTEDGRKHGRVTMLTASLSTDEVLDYYLSAMTRRGWSVSRRFRDGMKAVLVFHKGMDITNVTVAPAGSMTQILVNEESIR